MTAVDESPQRERVTDRAFRVLRTMKDMGSGPHPLGAIINRSALSRSTVQRVIHSGLKAGVIEQVGHGHYTLTRPEPPSQPLTSPFAQRALRNLAHRLGHSASLHAAVLTDIPVQVCTGTVDRTGHASPPPTVGPRSLRADASGRAIMAYLDLPHPDPAERRLVRARGWASTPGPTSGAYTIAAPVLRFDIAVGALAIAVVPGSGGAGHETCIAELRRTSAVLAMWRQ
ncbi:hypothetical protein [Streptomyces lavendulocolor]|uniref:hypothetical protein n=1 Tax=Streptomyces lavendulocolor TaxID=67316 RepID=UPI003C2C9EF6